MQSGTLNGRMVVKMFVAFMVVVVMMRVGIFSGVIVGAVFLFVFGMIMAGNRVMCETNHPKRTGSIEDYLKQKNDDLFYDDDDDAIISRKHKNDDDTLII